jgi:streptogramin lyase
VRLFPLPKERRNANLNTASFDRQGVLWFTGQMGDYGRLDPKTAAITVHDAPRGAGPYGIATTPDGEVFFRFASIGMQACASWRAARARSGAPSPALTSCSC